MTCKFGCNKLKGKIKLQYNDFLHQEHLDKYLVVHSI